MKSIIKIVCILFVMILVISMCSTPKKNKCETTLNKEYCDVLRKHILNFDNYTSIEKEGTQAYKIIVEDKVYHAITRNNEIISIITGEDRTNLLGA